MWVHRSLKKGGEFSSSPFLRGIEQGGFIFGKGEVAEVTEKQVAKIVKNGLVKAKQKARPDHELY
ncbi:hypothetical protein, partial [Pseudanabaena galeata]|uniref:hypothetical protein n=1 Tax=Pseudanabaena galeata TaxID=1112103 RepID=UPI002B1F6802